MRSKKNQPETTQPDVQVNKVATGDLFTPGPWKVNKIEFPANDEVTPYYTIVNDSDTDIDTVAFIAKSDEMMAANYQLMAAAPEMLAVLRKSNDMIETCLIEGMWNPDMPQEFFEILKQLKKNNDSAIKKATTITE